MIHEGIIGERGCDGWVEWTTAESAYSYNPAVACGHFMILIAHGTDWGAPDDEHGTATIIDLTVDDPEIAEVVSVPFLWCQVDAERVVRELAERMDHPDVNNVVNATRDLWFALIQEGVV